MMPFKSENKTNQNVNLSNHGKKLQINVQLKLLTPFNFFPLFSFSSSSSSSSWQQHTTLEDGFHGQTDRETDKHLFAYCWWCTKKNKNEKTATFFAAHLKWLFYVRERVGVGFFLLPVVRFVAQKCKKITRWKTKIINKHIKKLFK